MRFYTLLFAILIPFLPVHAQQEEEVVGPTGFTFDTICAGDEEACAPADDPFIVGQTCPAGMSAEVCANPVIFVNLAEPGDPGTVCQDIEDPEICRSIASSHAAFAFDQQLQQQAMLTTARVFGFYNWAECDADWDDNCEWHETLRVPAGWQACRIHYRIIHRRPESGRNTHVRHRPAVWYEGDPENPDRFRGYRLQIRAYGSDNWADQWGARLRIGEIAILALRDEATNEHRYAAGCDMPVHGDNAAEEPPADPIPDDGAQVKIMRCQSTVCQPGRLTASVTGAGITFRIARQTRNVSLMRITLRAADGSADHSFDWPQPRSLHFVPLPEGDYVIEPVYFISRYDPTLPELHLGAKYIGTE